MVTTRPSLPADGTVFQHPASAVADATTDDLHCYIVSTELIASKDSLRQTAGLMGAFYFSGKLDGRTPELDLENRVMAELPKLTGDTLRAEQMRCGAELKTRGQAAAAMGKDMQQRGAKMLEEDNSH